MKLQQGKLPPGVLAEILNKIQIRDKSIVVGPKLGFDSSVIDMGEKYLVISIDPSFFIPENIPKEFFAFGTVHWPASDVAVFGAKPKWMLYSLILPVGISEESAKSISSLIYEEARKANIDVIGGHTGVYKIVESPTASATVIGEASKEDLVLPSEAKEGDYIIVTKHLGFEFVVALSYHEPERVEKIVGSNSLKKFQEGFRKLTVVEEALALANAKIPNAMHDVTEGGFLVALKEVAINSNIGFEVFEENLIPPPEIRDVLLNYKIDYLRVSSTGCLIASIPKERLEEAENVLRKMNIPFNIVGRFTKGGYKIIDEKGRSRSVKIDFRDDFAKYFS